MKQQVIPCNLLTKCTFLQVEQVSEAVREEAELDWNVGDTGNKSDVAEHLVMVDTEESVEKSSKTTKARTNTQAQRTKDMEVRKMSEG